MACYLLVITEGCWFWRETMGNISTIAKWPLSLVKHSPFFIMYILDFGLRSSPLSCQVGEEAASSYCVNWVLFGLVAASSYFVSTGY